MTIERLADAHLVLSESRWSTTDPVRRLLRDRAQHAGVRVNAHIEVEFQSAALELASRGVADTVVSLPAAWRNGYLDRLHWVSFDPALYETRPVRRPGRRSLPALLPVARPRNDHVQCFFAVITSRVRASHRR